MINEPYKNIDMRDSRFKYKLHEQIIGNEYNECF